MYIALSIYLFYLLCTKYGHIYREGLPLLQAAIRQGHSAVQTTGTAVLQQYSTVTPGKAGQLKVIRKFF